MGVRINKSKILEDILSNTTPEGEGPFNSKDQLRIRMRVGKLVLPTLLDNLQYGSLIFSGKNYETLACFCRATDAQPQNYFTLAYEEPFSEGELDPAMVVNDLIMLYDSGEIPTMALLSKQLELKYGNSGSKLMKGELREISETSIGKLCELTGYQRDRYILTEQRAQELNRLNKK